MVRQAVVICLLLCVIGTAGWMIVLRSNPPPPPPPSIQYDIHGQQVSPGQQVVGALALEPILRNVSRIDQRTPLAEQEARVQAELEPLQGEIAAKLAQRPTNGRTYQLPTADGPTTRDLFQQHFAYRLREVAEFEQINHDSPEVHAAGSKFLTELFRYWESGTGQLTREEVLASGQAALAAGTQDPLVVGYKALLELNDPKVGKQALQTLSNAARKLKAAGYSAQPLYFQTLAVFIQMNQLKQTNAVPLEVQDAAEAAYLLLDKDGADPALRRVLYRSLRLRFPRDFFGTGTGLLYRAVLQSKNCDPWLRQMFAGSYHEGRAWVARGGGFAADVTEAGWKEFQEENERAARHYLAAWVLDPTTPEPASKLLSISQHVDFSEFTAEDWLTLSLANEADHADALETYQQYLRPRWGGSVGQMVRFAKDCLTTERPDTCLMIAGLKSLQEIQMSEFQSTKPITGEPGVASAVVTAARRFTAATAATRFPPEHDPNRLICASHLAALLVQMNRPDLAYEVSASQPDFDLFDNSTATLGLPLRMTRSLIAACAPEYRELVLPIDQQLRRPVGRGDVSSKLDSWIEQCQRIPDSESSKWSDRYFESAGYLLELQRQFARGEWVNLEGNWPRSAWFTPGDSAFRFENGEYTANASERTAATLKSILSFTPPYVLEGEFEPRQRTAFQSGFLIGKVPQGSLAPIGIRRELITIDPSVPLAAASFNSEQTGDLVVTMTTLAERPTSKIRLTVWQEAFEAIVDDIPLMAGYRSSVEPAPPIAVVLMVSQYLQQSTRYTGFGMNEELHVRNLRIRSVTDAPPPPEGQWAERRLYYQQRGQQEPASFALKLQAASAGLYTETPKDAVRELHQLAEQNPAHGEAQAKLINFYLEHRQYEIANRLYESIPGSSWYWKAHAVKHFAFWRATSDDDAYRDHSQVMQQLRMFTHPLITSSFRERLAIAALAAEQKDWKQAAEQLAQARQTLTPEFGEDWDRIVKQFEQQQPFRSPTKPPFPNQK